MSFSCVHRLLGDISRQRSFSNEFFRIQRRRTMVVEHLEDRRLLSVGGWPQAAMADETGLDERPDTGTTFVPGEILVGFEGDVATTYQRTGAAAAMNAARKIVGDYGLHSPKILPLLPKMRERAARLGTYWELGHGADVLDTVNRLTGIHGIAYAEPNYYYSIDATIPDDTEFSKLWGLDDTIDPEADIDAPEAWDIAHDSTNVVVAGIDTGVDYTHEDLYLNIFLNQGEIPGELTVEDVDNDGLITFRDLNDEANFHDGGPVSDLNGNGRIDAGDLLADPAWANGTDEDGNGFTDDLVGWDFCNDDNDPFDDNGHGTHTAGTIGAVGNNGTGVSGVTWSTQIMGVKFLDSGGSGTTDDAVDSVNYVANMDGSGVKLSNNSWGGGEFSQALKDAITLSAEADQLFVASAGNGNSDNDLAPQYPCTYDNDNIISVAATDRHNRRASFSNWGLTTVDVAAPGVDIWSTTPDDTYASYNGTSMASPHVAGTATLAWELAGAVPYTEMRNTILESAARPANDVPDLDPSGDTPIATGGRANALDTLEAISMGVANSSPAAGEVVSPDKPTAFEIEFTQPYDPKTLEASDLTVNGISSDSYTMVDDGTVRFKYDQSPVTTEGEQTMAIAAEAVSASENSGLPEVHRPIRGWNATFRWDTTRLDVDSATPFSGSTISIPAPGATTTITLQFNEEIDADSVDTSDLVLNQGYVSAATPVYPNDDSRCEVAEYTVKGLAQEGTLTVELPPGVLTDTFGNPNLGHSGSYSLDWDSFPCLGIVDEMQAARPRGSLIYDLNISGLIDPSSDLDSFTLDVDPEQTITVVVRPDTSLTPTVELSGPSGDLASDAAASAGEEAVIEAVGPTSSGTYTVTVGSAEDTSTGAYTLQLILNAAVEAESHGGPGNDSRETAQNIEPSFVPLADGAARGAVLGMITATPTEAVSLLEGFEDGNIVEYVDDVGGDPSNALVTEAAGFRDEDNDGIAYGLEDRTNSGTGGWLYRDDVQVGQGDRISVWVKSVGTASGQGHFGFGASDAGSLSMVMDADTNELLLQENRKYEYKDIGTSHQVWLGDHWYRMEVDWGTDGQIVGRLYDSDGTTLLNTVTGKHNAVKSGGIAFRSVSSTKCFDTIQLLSGDGPFYTSSQDVYSFELTEDETATAMLTTKNGQDNVDLEVWNDTDWIMASGGATNVNRMIDFSAPSSGTYYARVSGIGSASGTEYSLVVNRGAGFDLEDNDGMAHAQPFDGDSGILGSIASTGKYVDTFVTVGSGGLDEPAYATFGPDGNLYVSKHGGYHGHEVLRYDGSTGEFIDVFVSDDRLEGAADLVFGSDGNLYVVSYSTHQVLRFHGTEGTFMDVFASGGGLDGPSGLEFGPDGNLYVGGWYSDAVHRYDDETGDFIDLFVPPGSGGLDGPWDFVFRDGHLYLASAQTDQVLRYDGTTGEFLDIFASGAGLDRPHGLAFGPEGRFYVADAYNDRVLRFDGTTGAFIDVYASAGSGGLDYPGDILFGPGGNLYVASRHTDEVLRYHGPVGYDYYQIDVQEGDQIDLKTSTPSGGTGVFANDLDPMLRLYGPSGALVTMDDNSASDSRNASLQYYVPSGGAGTYYVEVCASDAPEAPLRAGEYFLNVDVSQASPAPGISVSKMTLTTSESGDTDTFDVRIETDPGEDVTVTIPVYSDDTSEGTASPSELTFKGGDSGNWDTPQTVTVEGVDDLESDGDKAYEVVIGPATADDENSPYHGLDAANVCVTNLDDEVPPDYANNMYVWDIGFYFHYRANGKFIDLKAKATIQRDSNADNESGSHDARVEGASVTIVVTDPENTEYTYTKDTSADGMILTDYIKNVTDGIYVAEVTGLTHATYTWDPDDVLDPTSNDEDADGNGYPDDSCTPPVATSRSVTTRLSIQPVDGTEDDAILISSEQILDRSELVRVATSSERSLPRDAESEPVAAADALLPPRQLAEPSLDLLAADRLAWSGNYERGGELAIDQALDELLAGMEDPDPLDDLVLALA